MPMGIFIPCRAFAKLYILRAYATSSRQKIDNICVCVKSNIVCLFVCFVALRPKSTAMIMAGRSVHLTTPLLEIAVLRAHMFSCN